MTVTQAAAIWIAEKKRRDETAAAFDEAAKVLKAHLRESGRSEYASKAGTIGYARTIRKLLDQEKAKAHLGKRLPEFMKETEVESLSLLK